MSNDKCGLCEKFVSLAFECHENVIIVVINLCQSSFSHQWLTM